MENTENENTLEKREKMKEVAVARMKALRMLEQPIIEFRQGRLNESARMGANIGGILYWLDKKEMKEVEKFEEQTGNMVYHVVHDYTSFGEIFTYLYVSPYEDEWPDEDWALVGAGEDEEVLVYAYVRNATHPECSEMGSVMIKPANGGIMRTA